MGRWEGLLQVATRGRSIRGIAAIGGGTVLGQVIVLAVSPILTRLFGPSEFGILGLYSAIVAVVAILSSLRFEQAIPVVEEEEAGPVFVLSVWLVLLTTLGSLLITILISLFNNNAFGDNYWIFVLFVPLGILTAGLYQVLNSWAIRDEQYGIIGQTKVAQGIGLAVVQVASGVLGWGAPGLILGDLFGRGGGVSSLSRVVRVRIGDVVRTSWEEMVGVYRSFSDYPRHIAVATVWSSGSLYMPYLALEFLFGVKAVGLFVLVQRIVGTPSSLLGKSIATVYYGRAAESQRSGLDSGRLLRRGMATLLLVGVPLGAIAMVGAEVVFATVFGQGWSEAGQMATWMIPSQVVALAVVPFSQTFNIFNKLSRQKWIDFIRFILSVLAFVLSYIFGADLILTIGLYSAALFVAYSIQGYAVLRVAGRGRVEVGSRIK